ncbi:MAG: hypothetical protein U1E21_04450 [Reyranellaceae bacterium]
MVAKRRTKAVVSDTQGEPYPHGPYFKRPDRTVEEALREHIRLTGTPETFPGMILRPLPPEATVELVLKSYTIDRSKRADRDRAPCAQCSPASPKYLNGGAIWCQQDGWMRQFGCDCVERAIGTVEYRLMQHRKKERDALLDAEDFLLANWWLVGVLRQYLGDLLPLAEALENNRERIDHTLRGWRTKLREATKGSGQLLVHRRKKIERDEDGERIGPRGFGGSGDFDTVTEAMGPFLGAVFVQRTFQPMAAVNRLLLLLPNGDWSSDDAAFETYEGLDAAARVSVVQRLRRIATETPQVAARLEEARLFFTPDAIHGLGMWGADKEASLPFTARVVGDNMEIRHIGQTCRIGLLNSLSVPAPDDRIAVALAKSPGDWSAGRSNTPHSGVVVDKM